jgi:hypothetical protein
MDSRRPDDLTGDPVSWFLIEPGWRVEASDGREVGRVLEVTGDSSADIFDGLAVASSMFRKPRYVPAEQVAAIVDGHIRLRLDHLGVEQLGEFVQPAEEDRIESEPAPVTSRIETAVATPSSRRASIPFLRRILLWFGLAGRR